ncbi:MAG TPA: glycosyltransferase [Armatimonadetes bacterium]|nr:glycosyltransferase [Armatimonadota bacterium]
MRKAVVVVGKVPRPGMVKSRLARSLGEERAACLYECFLLDTVEAVAGLEGVEVVVSLLGGLLESLKEIGPKVRVIPQRGETFGRRLRNSIADALDMGYRPVVLLGSDNPSLPPEAVAEAFEALRRCDVVIGPATDGGYYLIGMHRLHEGLFSDEIEWGTERVLGQTLERCRREGLSVSLIRPWYDVDTLKDLAFLKSHIEGWVLSGDHIPCPRTAKFLLDHLELDGLKE